MTIRTITLTCLIASAAMAQAPCLPVAGAQITGADLKRAIPAWAAISSNVPLAPAPLPGSTRIFYPSELQSVAARFSLPIASAREVCFRLATAPLSPDRIVESMRNALRIPYARIELLETSTEPAPAGAIEFKREDLGAPASADRQTPVLWRGNVVYAGDRRFAIWAKVRITAQLGRVVAVEALRSGVAVRPEQVREEIFEGFPIRSAGGVSLERIAGMVPVHPVAAGAEVRLENLTRPNDVNRGDMVHVDVRFGAAHLILVGQAESAGHIGDVVAVRNPESSRVFRALVDGADKVVVEPGKGERN